MKIIGLFIILIGLYAIIFMRFSNPQMTETQLFISQWFNYLVACGLVFYGVSLVTKK